MALLLSILDSCTTTGNCIRLVTLRLATMLLLELLGVASGDSAAAASGGDAAASGNRGPVLQDYHIALIENIYESAVLRLRLFYKVRGRERCVKGNKED